MTSTTYRKSLENELSSQIIGAAIEVHKELGGPGLLESIYESALCHELTLRGLNVKRQTAVEIIYKGTRIKDPLFIDVIVDDKVFKTIGYKTGIVDKFWLTNCKEWNLSGNQWGTIKRLFNTKMLRIIFVALTKFTKIELLLSLCLSSFVSLC